MELKVISAQDLAKMNPDKSYFLPWNVDMLYQVEPGLNILFFPVIFISDILTAFSLKLFGKNLKKD